MSGLVVLLMLIAAPLSFAQVTSAADTSNPVVLETGLPAMQSFHPEDLEFDFGEVVHEQNFGVVQAATGLIYVANGTGVMEFDGDQWRMVLSGVAVRSLAIDDATGRLYVGLRADFGYLDVASDGRFEFISLLGRISEQDRDFAEIWKTYVSPLGVVFASTRKLFLFADEKIRVWSSDSGLHATYLVGERVIVFDPQRGLMELTEQGLDLLPEGNLIVGERVAAVLPRPDMGPNALLVCTREKGFFVHDGIHLRREPSDADELFSSSMQNLGTRLSDGRLAMTSYAHDLYFLNDNGHLISQTNDEMGLPSTGINALFEDRERGLWLAMDRGLVRLDVGSPESSHDERIGLKGKAFATQTWKDSLYVATSEGVFIRRAGFGPRYSKVDTINGYSWCLTVVGKSLLACNQFGVYELNGERAQLIFEADNVSSIVPIGSDASQMVVGARRTVTELQRDGASWRVRGSISGIDDPIAGWAAPDGALWFTSQFQGVARVTLSPNASLRSDTLVEHFGVAQGLTEYPDTNRVVAVGGQLRVLNRKGVNQFDSRSRQFIPDPAFSELKVEPGRPFMFIAPNMTGYWLLVEKTDRTDELGLAVMGRDGMYRWQTFGSAVSSIRSSSMLSSDSGGLWLGGANGLIRRQNGDPDRLEQQFDVSLRSVASGSARPSYVRSGAVGEVTFDFPQNRLKFAYSAINFSALGRVEYQVFLDGFDTEWSRWTREAHIEYANLLEGDYEFKIRARSPSGLIAEAVPYTFSILPPWYRSSIALFFYVAVLAAMVYLLVRWRTRSLLAQRNQLRMRLSLLQAQLEPHFVFNSLSAISYLVRSANKKDCLQAISTLSSLLRYALLGSGRSWVTLRDEMGMVADYVSLQRLRFGDRLEFVSEATEEGLQFPCPTLLLQPLMENAIKFGVGGASSVGKVELLANVENGSLCLTVRNSIGDVARSHGFGIGLGNTRDRVKLLYGSRGLVDVRTEDGMFVVFIQLARTRNGAPDGGVLAMED